MDSVRQIDGLAFKFKVKRCFVKLRDHVEFMQDLEDRIKQFQIIKLKNKIVRSLRLLEQHVMTKM